ncbi:hypothetical protein CRENBAI_026802 [Crenichthys baileyi]|uniref:Uncharacterized protein n=1 Tax=Crenichthys baileyi TaxID=28760 RepID=A0AAV9QX00_9TELE
MDLGLSFPIPSFFATAQRCREVIQGSNLSYSIYIWLSQNSSRVSTDVIRAWGPFWRPGAWEDFSLSWGVENLTLLGAASAFQQYDECGAALFYMCVFIGCDFGG